MGNIWTFWRVAHCVGSLFGLRSFSLSPHKGTFMSRKSMERNEKNRDDFPWDAEFMQLLPASESITAGQCSQNTHNMCTNYDCLVHLLYIWKFCWH